jgi:ParB-like chromosome segregation protein Spo0J
MEWELVSKKIKDLKAHPHNPRKLSKHDFEQLGTSLGKFGLIDKPIINRNGTIIGGHQRVAVLKRTGVKEIECWQPVGEPLSEKDEAELNIRLNRNVGEWDWDILANEWNITDLMDWGFLTDEINIESKEFDESLTNNLSLIVRFKIQVPVSDADMLEEALDIILKNFPDAKKERLI